jgi:glucosyl-3-phosphoglycerate phosphatase
MLNLNNLKHKYFVMRHGHSVPNESGLIVSKLVNGTKSEYGLTSKGKEQARLAAKLFSLQVKFDLSSLIIYHSPFSRAKETAKLVAKEFNCKLFGENENLRERDFGDFELTSDKGYQLIWEQDKLNPDSTFKNSESPNAVQERMLKVIAECEKLDEEYGQNIFLVGHADSIHILETAFRNIEVQNHRDIPYIRNAEIRALN